MIITKRKKITASLALLILLSAFLYGVPVLAEGKLVRERKFEPFSILTFKGTRLDLADLNGSPIVINFWGSWCYPCRVEAPTLEKVYKNYKSSGVEFVGVAVQDLMETAVEFVEEFHITYPNGMDKKDALMDKYEAYVLPMTLVIDREGNVVYRHFGVVDGKNLSRAIEKAL